MIIPPGFEARAIDTARRALDDIPECAGASYRVKWLPSGLPLLVIEFAQFFRRGASPACAVALATVRRGTLQDLMPGRTLLAGDRLRDNILTAVHGYFRACPPSPTSVFLQP